MKGDDRFAADGGPIIVLPMRKGCVISPKDLNAPALLREFGYEYAEVSISTMGGMSDGELSDFEKALNGSGLRCETVNILFTRDIRLTGPEMKPETVNDYLTALFAKTERFGYETVVFGSGGSRRVPEDFPMEDARRQLDLVCRELLHPLAVKYGFVVALEELNTGECNILTSAAETNEMVNRLGLSTIKLVLDNYHIALVDEPYESLAEIGANINHVHMSHPRNRLMPCVGDGADDEYDAFFTALRGAGYDGRVTLEARQRIDLREDLRTAAELLARYL